MQLALADAGTGAIVRLERISEEVELDMDALAYLDGHRFTPGSTATVASRAPDGTLVLDVDGATVALGPALARRLYVAPA